MNTLVMARRWFLLISTLWLAGCQLINQKPSNQTPESTHEIRGAQQIVVPPAPVSVKPSLQEKLLRQAEEAFRDGRFVSPVHDNAYDKFHSVLMLDSGNSKAKAGIQAILLRYTQLVRSHLRYGRLKAAQTHLATIEPFFPANALVLDLKREIQEAKERELASASASNQKHVPVLEEIALSPTALSAKSPSVTETLVSIAQRIRDSDESVLIFARNDAEGRWIYGQLKDAAQGYRVRGDIRISESPKIRILPPL